jgi:hypothetical protein
MVVAAIEFQRLQLIAEMVKAMLADDRNRITTAYRLTLESMLNEQ